MDLSKFVALVATLKMHSNSAKELADLNVWYGANMSYSGFLEQGTSRMAARPHIIPSIELNSNHISTEMSREVATFIAFHVQVGLPPVNMKMYMTRKLVEVLNGKPRMFAMANAPFRYGNHMRSILATEEPRDVITLGGRR